MSNTNLRTRFNCDNTFVSIITFLFIPDSFLGKGYKLIDSLTQKLCCECLSLHRKTENIYLPYNSVIS